MPLTCVLVHTPPAGAQQGRGSGLRTAPPPQAPLCAQAAGGVARGAGRGAPSALSASEPRLCRRVLGPSSWLAAGGLGGTRTSALGQERLVLAHPGHSRLRSSPGQERWLRGPTRIPSFLGARCIGSWKAGTCLQPQEPQEQARRERRGGVAGSTRGVWRGWAHAPMRQGQAALQPRPCPRTSGAEAHHASPPAEGVMAGSDPRPQLKGPPGRIRSGQRAGVQ